MKILAAIGALAVLATFSAPALAADKLVANRLPVRHLGEVFEIQISADSKYAITTSTTPLESGTTDVKVWRLQGAEVVFKDEAVTEAPPVEIISGLVVRFEKVDMGAVQRRMRLLDVEGDVAALVANETVLHVARTGATVTVISHIGGTDADGKAIEDVIRVHSGPGGASPRAIKLGTSADDAATRIAVSRDGSKLVFAGKAHASVLDVKSGKIDQVAIGAGPEEVPAVGIADDGSLLYTLDSAQRLVMRRTTTLEVVGSAKLAGLEDAPTWSQITEVKRGEMLELTRARANAFVDVKSGKTTWAARGSSVNRYRMDAIGPDLLLRAFRSRSNPTTWGLIRRAGGDFKDVYKVESRVALGSLTTSRNGRCLTLVTDQDVMIVDPVTRREIGKATGVPKDLYRGMFTPNGRTFVVGGSAGEVIAILTPSACHS